MKYFARLTGDLSGIDRWCSFDADNDVEAQEIADSYAEDNYSEYADPFDEDDSPNFGAVVEQWSDEKHAEWIGDAAFTEH